MGMMTLFKVDSRTNIVLNKVCVKLCPEFKNLDDNQIAYIVLAYDYHSKYKQFPELERKKKARYEVYADAAYNAEKGKLMSIAIESYVGMQYDPRRETIKAYKKKIETINTQLQIEEAPNQIASYMNATSKMLDYIGALQREVDRDENKMLLKGDGELSYIEQLHEGKQNLEDYLNTRVKLKAVENVEGD